MAPFALLLLAVVPRGDLFLRQQAAAIERNHVYNENADKLYRNGLETIDMGGGVTRFCRPLPTQEASS